MKHGDPRPSTVGPDSGPEPPFPLKLEGPVVKGFGRGSKELGIPTANIPLSGLSVAGHTDLASGVYFGFCSLAASGASQAGNDDNSPSSQEASSHTLSSTPQIYPMVMSLGYNPFYKNTVRSVEVHVMHTFAGDFYGAHLKLLILGFVREELDYVSKEALIEDIQTDIRVARESLGREGWKGFEGEEWLVERSEQKGK